MAKNDEGAATVEQIRLGLGFHEGDRDFVVSALAALNRHLGHWKSESVEVHLSVKDRERKEQQFTLEIRLPHRPSLIVHVSDPSIDRALVEARRLMIREIDEVRSGFASPSKNAHHGEVDRNE